MSNNREPSRHVVRSRSCASQIKSGRKTDVTKSPSKGSGKSLFSYNRNVSIKSEDGKSDEGENNTHMTSPVATHSATVTEIPPMEGKNKLAHSSSLKIVPFSDRSSLPNNSFDRLQHKSSGLFAGKFSGNITHIDDDVCTKSALCVHNINNGGLLPPSRDQKPLTPAATERLATPIPIVSTFFIVVQHFRINSIVLKEYYFGG